jgi:hypothetical protein
MIFTSRFCVDISCRSVASIVGVVDEEPYEFETFPALQVLAEFLRLVAHRNSRRGGVGVQIFQTLSIMIQVRKPDRLSPISSENYTQCETFLKYD